MKWRNGCLLELKLKNLSSKNFNFYLLDIIKAKLKKQDFYIFI